ncbi:hypothetical protein [Dactylosporangium sp. CA-233914]|uniref:hypothetical protein n=1 Tax=Dactylosporangium sp. CA-233914 TaxID=3239934 RepID=UPI003D8CB3EE
MGGIGGFTHPCYGSRTPAHRFGPACYNAGPPESQRAWSRDEDLTDDQATRDLRTLLDRGLLEQRGQTRGRYYVAAGPVLAIAEGLGRPAPLRDLYRG